MHPCRQATTEALQVDPESDTVGKLGNDRLERRTGRIGRQQLPPLPQPSERSTHELRMSHLQPSPEQVHIEFDRIDRGAMGDHVDACLRGVPRSMSDDLHLPSLTRPTG